MKEIVNKFLLKREKFIPEVHSRQPEFPYNSWRLFTKNKERIQKFKEKGDSKYTFQNKLDEVCFQYDLGYWDFKGLPRRTRSHKVLRDKVFNIAKNSKYDGCQRSLGSMIYTFFDENSSAGAVTRANKSAIKKRITSYQQLAKEFHKSNIRKFEKRNLYSSCKDNMWGADFADIQLIRN